MKTNLIIYHFLVEIKQHERVHLLITSTINIYQTEKREKKYLIKMKTCFPEEKQTMQFGTPFFY